MTVMDQKEKKRKEKEEKKRTKREEEETENNYNRKEGKQDEGRGGKEKEEKRKRRRRRTNITELIILTHAFPSFSPPVIAEQAVSFSVEDSYLEVPAWREGSLAFSFRTTSSQAVLAYQPAYHPDHATFRIALLGGEEK